jgi:carboxypeptidase Taq
MATDLMKFYEEYKNKISAFRFVFAGIHYDQATIAPKDGLEYGNEMLAIFEGEYFSYATDAENIKKIEALNEETTDPILKKELALRLRELHEISLLPKEVYVDYQKLVAEGHQCWEKAKEADDYGLFKPHLISLIEKKKQMLGYYEFEGSDYDHLLDGFQMGMNAEKYDAFFAEIKEKLVPLIHRIKESGRRIDTSALKQGFDVSRQKVFTERLKEALKIDSKKCYLTESAHPFSSYFSISDARFTTMYLSENPMSAVLSTAHEYGHALYGLHMNPAFEKTMFEDGIGLGMHESQSRMIENYVGRNRGFWSCHYSALQELFPEQLGAVALGDFLDMMNASVPGLIRIEADELCYPLHVLIRYELEKDIFAGNADYDSLDRLWADKYEEYLGVRPRTAREGILQDVHWSEGYFGYFPTYALGSAFAAQFYRQMGEDLNVDEVLGGNRFEKIAEWLRVNIHQFGASKSFDEVLRDVTGEGFNPRYYTDYLVSKYEGLYF